MRILYVEDNFAQRIILQSILEKEFICEVLCLSDGKEAIDYMEKDNDFDLIISDFYMPNVDGIELYLHLTERSYDIPFILFTSCDIRPFEKYIDAKKFIVLSKNGNGKKLTTVIEILFSANGQIIFKLQ